MCRSSRCSRLAWLLTTSPGLLQTQRNFARLAPQADRKQSHSSAQARLLGYSEQLTLDLSTIVPSLERAAVSALGGQFAGIQP